MTTECEFTISRRISPEFCIFVWPSSNRGRREDRVLAAPAVSRAICANKTAHEHTGQRETLRPSLRNGFTAYFVLFPENGSIASVASGTLPANLTPAPRRPNHTTSPYVRAAHVRRGSRVHRIPPRVVTMANAPHPRETSGVMRLICVDEKAEYFRAKGWTGFD